MSQIGTPSIVQSSDNVVSIEGDGSAETEVYDIYVDDGGGPTLVDSDVPATAVYPDILHYFFATNPGDGDTIGVVGKAAGFDDSEMATVVWNITGSHFPILGGTNSGAVTEDAATSTTGGTLTITDPDSGDDAYQLNVGPGSYGDFDLQPDGTWTYTLNNSSPAVQALTAGEIVSDDFVAISHDNLDSQSVSITITGASDNTSATLGGTNSGSVTENAATTTTSGTLTITDPDSGEAQYRTASTTGTYGAFTLGTNGVWTYTLNNSDTDTNNLSAGQSVTDVFLATSNDGSASRNVTITITGAADTALLGGTATGTVIKDNATTSTGGTLTITDPDSGEERYQTRNTTGTYGTFTLATTGVWTYTINNSDADVVALTTGQVVSDVFVATSNDGTASQNVTITVRESAAGSFGLTLAQKRFHLLIR